MYAAHRLAASECKAQYAAYLVHVHARHERRHEHDGQARRGAVVYGPELFGGEVPAAQARICLRTQPVELQKGAGDPCLAQLFRVAVLRGEAQPVGVELEEGEAPLPAETHYLGQVAAHGGLAAGHEHVV